MRHGILHKSPPHRHQPDRIPEIQNPAGNKGSILPQAVSCKKIRLYGELLIKYLEYCYTRSKYSRLRIPCQVKFCLRALKAEPCHVKPGDTACLIKDFFCSSITFIEFLPHAYTLRTLSGEDKGDFGFRILDFGF